MSYPDSSRLPYRLSRLGAHVAPLVLGILSASMLFGGCRSLPDVALDPPITETLKQRITKSRNAIVETRRTLARASGSAYVQELKIRLGELLSDEARAHYQVARAREGVSNKALQVPQVKTLKQQSVLVYEEFLTEYPSSRLRARALFNMGQELRELGDYDTMRDAFERLVRELPAHPLTLEALLVLGNDYFDRNKLEEAARRYEKITSAQLHKVSGLAHYKLAWVRMNQDRCADAITSFEAALNASKRWLNIQQRENPRERSLEGSEFDVRRGALVDMMFCYSKERPEKGAVAHLKTLAYDRGPLVAALEKLSRRYVILERNHGLRDVSRALLDLGPDSKRRRSDAENLHGALKKLKDYQSVGEDVARLTETFTRVVRSAGFSESERARILIRFELLARDLSTSAQIALEKRIGSRDLAALRPTLTQERAELRDSTTAQIQNKRVKGKDSKNKRIKRKRAQSKRAKTKRSKNKCSKNKRSKSKRAKNKQASKRRDQKGAQDTPRDKRRAQSPKRAHTQRGAKLHPLYEAATQLETGYVRYLETFGSHSGVSALVDSANASTRASTSVKKRGDKANKSSKQDPQGGSGDEGDEGVDLRQSEIDVLANLAALYSRTGHDYLAGQRFYERAQLLDPQGGEDAYQAVLHFKRALSVEGRPRRELVIARASLRRAAAQLLSSKLSNTQGPQVRFAIALTFYEEGRLREAIEYLSAVAAEYPKTVQGDSATLLVLDAYKQLSDFEGLAATGSKLLALGMSSSLQARVKKLVNQAQQLALDELALEAAGVDGGDVSAELIDFAQSSSGGLGERALINAFIAAQNEGDLKAMEKVAALIKESYPKSSQLLGVWSGIARTAAAQLQIDKAVASYKLAMAFAPGQRAQLMAASAELSAQLGDIEGALSGLKVATSNPESDDRIFALYVRTLLNHSSPKRAWTALEPLADRGSGVIAAARGYLYVLRGQYDEAEETLQAVIEAGDNLEPYARALGLYALAEVNTHFLRGFTPGDSIDELGEWITLMELAEQSYLRVVRVGDPRWGSAALNRLAALSKYASDKIVTLKAPSELGSRERVRFAASFKKRAQILKNQSTQALKACRELGLKRGVFPPPVRACLNNAVMSVAEVSSTQISARSTRAGIEIGLADREALARNPSDVKAATRLGRAFLKAGDPHLARLAFAKATQGGGVEVQNLYGVACARAGDYEGAIQGFGRAAVSGLDAGIENAIKLLSGKLGVSRARELTRDAWRVTVSGGMKW